MGVRILVPLICATVAPLPPLASAAQTAPTPVILISIDTLRADHLGIYGYRGIRTPNIDSFARHGTVFEAVESQVPLTLPSHTSLFTSIYPFENGIEENGQHVPAGTVTLASVLRAHGYKTAAFAGSVQVDRSTGLDQGFDFYDSPFRGLFEESRNPFAVGVRRDGALVLRAARQWLGENRSQPVFAFVHLFDLHAPYAQAASSGGLPNRAGYDAEVAYIDRLLGEFQKALSESGWWERSLVLVLSDHGEGLGDHGELSHGYFIYQSTLGVPLIIHWPERGPAYAPRVNQPCGLIDVAPTILDHLKLPAPPSFEGASLLPAARGDADDGRAVFSESVYARDAFHWAPLRAIRAGAREYIDAPKPELYDLRRDPGELHNLAAEDSRMAADLRARLTARLARGAAKAPAASPGLSAETRRTLESLGYLGSGPEAAGSDADPKARLPEYNLFERGLAFLYSGGERAAIASLREALARDPHNVLARYYLGDAYLRARQPESAIREWTAALEFDPAYAPAAEALGAYWMGREDYSKARVAFHRALAATPDDYAALLGLGAAEEHLGLLADALRDLAAACKIAPDPAPCNRKLEAVQQRMK